MDANRRGAIMDFLSMALRACLILVLLEYAWILYRLPHVALLPTPIYPTTLPTPIYPAHLPAAPPACECPKK